MAVQPSLPSELYQWEVYFAAADEFLAEGVMAIAIGANYGQERGGGSRVRLDGEVES
ncbi:MAG: hypothetical protein Q9161_002472 [Pseudevernia consocians]